MLRDMDSYLGTRLVAVIADAGGGKTQLAAQLTAPQTNRPAGILLHGRDLRAGQGLDSLDADENPNLLGLRERGMKFVKAADEKIADETIKEARVVTKQDAEAVTQALA